MTATPPDGPWRLALVLPDLDFGGTERVALELAREWTEQGHEVDFVLMRVEGTFLDQIPPGSAIVDLKAPRVRDVPFRLARYLKARRPHGVQVSMWPLTIASLIAHRLARSSAGIVVSEHCPLSLQYPGRSWRRTVMAATIQHFYPQADARVAVSRATALDLATLGSLDPATIEVIPNPAPIPAPLESPDPQVEALWGEGRPRLLTVGRLAPEKNHLMLVEALQEVRRSVDARLMIVGEGPTRDAILNAAKAAGVAPDVILAGYVHDPWPYYSSADLFVLSSDFEGYGLVLVEAMHAGLPIVSTDCENGPREILEDGEYGALTPCGDPGALAAAILSTLDSPPDRDRQRARGAALAGAGSAAAYLRLMMKQDHS